MDKKSKHIKIKISIILLAIILLIVSSVTVIVLGQKIEFVTDFKASEENIESISVSINREDIVEFTNREIENGFLKLEFESLNPGKAYLEIQDNNNMNSYTLYVHKTGVITLNDFFGYSRGSIIILISIIIFLSYFIVALSIMLKKNIKENMYQYRNIAYLGIIVFLSFTLIDQLFLCLNYRGIIGIIVGLFNLSVSFSYFILPIAFVTSIMVLISNIKLAKNEGMSWKNFLGIILGIAFCVSTVLPTVITDFIYNGSNIIDVHNLNGLAYYVYEFMEKTIYFIIAYMECVLIGTIILGIKSAKHIPSFDKDYIIILGCQIKKDGTLTNLLKSRVDRAIEFANMQTKNVNKDIIFVSSGGKGSDEVIAEGEAMKNYLVSQNIPAERILVENKSKNTFENIKFSKEIIDSQKKDAKIAFSTTNYHVFRAGTVATEQNIHVEGIGAGTKAYFWINAFIREFVATIYQERNKHLLFIFCLLSVILMMVYVLYISNNT